MRGGVQIVWPTCRPGTCSRTGGSEWGRCSGSRSWAARNGTSGTTSCSPCRSRICGSRRSSSGAARSRCGATTPWSVRCGWPACRVRRRRRRRTTARRRPPERAPPPPPSPSPRSRGARCARLNKLCLRPPWCALTQGWLTVQRWTFSSTDSPPPPPSSSSSHRPCCLQTVQFFLPTSVAQSQRRGLSSVSWDHWQSRRACVCVCVCVCVCLLCNSYYHYVNFLQW